MKNNGKAIITCLVLFLLVCVCVLCTVTLFTLAELRRDVAAQAEHIRVTGEQYTLYAAEIQNTFTSKMDEQRQSTREEMLSFQNALEERMRSEFARQNKVVSGIQLGIREQKDQTARIERTFADILSEQRKQHIDTVVADASLQSKMNAAQSYFTDGDYYRARELFAEVSSVQMDNYDAHFYSAYSLFLQNVMDSSVYAKVLSEFSLLEKNGYGRKEIDEVRGFIRQETSSADTGAGSNE